MVLQARYEIIIFGVVGMGETTTGSSIPLRGLSPVLFAMVLIYLSLYDLNPERG
jgi:hypothetical protein